MYTIIDSVHHRVQTKHSSFIEPETSHMAGFFEKEAQEEQYP